ncbi:MAG TPA: DUF2630 family protein [Actinomycetota bacterium]|jgi:coenzyme F420-reducing hydrogenase alpha subunit|nr:DUF2630 family protein [Actinomycetota bacterium]
MADDEDVIVQINQLAHEEHELFERESRGEASSQERARLKEIQVQLDQCYDLLHQRRARRAAGLDLDVESVRRTGTIESPRA